MKIALLGYGKMGKLIDELALERGHEIVARISQGDALELHNADIAIDFSTPESAFDNITYCFSQGVAVVSGTTGWLEKYDDAVSLCREQGSAFIYASNFSLGVNLFFALNERLAQMMNRVDQYESEMEEIHHTQKLDAPSGTAITLAEGIMDHTAYSDWSNEKPGPNTLHIKSVRQGQVPGTHTVSWKSDIDSIDITHTAHNRKGFALGAIIAAEWLLGKTGVFSMKDVLNLE